MRISFAILTLSAGIGKLLVFGALIATAAGAQSTMVVENAAVTAPISFFPYQGQWHGADVGYSIQLSAHRFLWLFGDTFVGRSDATRSSDDPMPRNSIGIADCPAGQVCKVTYAWTTHNSGPPTAFFDTGTAEFYWPLDGFVAKNTLYIFLEKMHTTADAGAFNFDYSGVVLASVKNFLDPPALWKVSYQPVLSGNTVIPGVAVVGPSALEAASEPAAKSGYAYAFTWTKNGGTPGLSLLRLPEKFLNAAEISSRHWQYLNDHGTWGVWSTPSALPGDAKTLVRGNYTELTVRYHTELQQWLMALPGGFEQGAILLSHAHSLTGSWSLPKPIYTIPELQDGNADHTPNVVCYAAKEHAELETNADFVFSYACNSTREADVMANQRLYHPIVVRLSSSTIADFIKK